MFPKPLILGCIIPVLQTAAGAYFLNTPVCSCIHSHPTGVRLMQALHSSIDTAAAGILPMGPHPYDCHSILLLSEATILAVLLYWK
jgi:hypothetical protein